MSGVMQEAAQANWMDLSSDRRAGQGIVIGLNPAGDTLLEVSWLAGKDEESLACRNSLNDRPDADNTENVDGAYVTGNGDHVVGILAAMKTGQTFQEAFRGAVDEHEPLSTPRIASSVTPSGDPEEENFANFEFGLAGPTNPTRLYVADALTVANRGLGHCINTYPDPESSTAHSERAYEVLPLGEEAHDTALLYWRNLHPAQRVEVAVRAIDLESRAVTSHAVGLGLLTRS